MPITFQNNICVVIPAYEPDERLIQLIKDLKQIGITRILVINDGSSAEYDNIFNTIKNEYDVNILLHEINKGKGRSLKDAFSYLIEREPELIGVVSADSDGQHTAEDILNISQVLANNQNCLILGVRDFSLENVPSKSKFGNNCTRNIMKALYGMKISDTQTGLRGIPVAFMKQLLKVKGERFEFETNMLVASKNNFEIFEVPIATVYDSKDHHQTHFDPIKDSIKIYKIFIKRIFSFLFSSLSSSLIDLLMFSFLTSLLKTKFSFYIMLSTIMARIISATYNYFMNYKIVFKSKMKHHFAMFRYIILAFGIMISSGLLVTLGTTALPGIPELFIKIPVDVFLFIVSYCVQRSVVF